MDILTHERNYIPIDLETRFHACKRVKESHWKISKTRSFYHVKRSYKISLNFVIFRDGGFEPVT